MQPIQAQHTATGEVLVWDAQDILTLRTKHRIVGKLVGTLPTFSQQNKFHSSPLLLASYEVSLLLKQGTITLHSTDIRVPHSDEVQQFEQERQDGFTNQLHNGALTKRKRPESNEEEPPKTVQPQVFDPTITIHTKGPRYKPTKEPHLWLFPSTLEERRKFRVYVDLYNKGMYVTDASKFGGDFLAYPGDPLRFHAQLLVVVVAPDHVVFPLDVTAFSRLGVSVKKWAAFAIAHEDPQQAIEYISFEWQGIT